MGKLAWIVDEKVKQKSKKGEGTLVWGSSISKEENITSFAIPANFEAQRSGFLHSLVKKEGKPYNEFQRSRAMSGKSSFPYRKYDRKPHPHIVKQILEDSELIEMMKEVLIQEGKPCPFCHRKLKEDQKVSEIW